MGTETTFVHSVFIFIVVFISSLLRRKGTTGTVSSPTPNSSLLTNLRRNIMVRTTKRTGKGKRDLLNKRGLDKVPRGKEVHHKKPLKKGGSDTLKNVKLVSKKTHKKIHKKK